MDPISTASSLLSSGVLNPVISEVRNIFNVDPEVVKLQASYTTIVSFLDERRGSRSFPDSQLKNWMEDLEGYCYDAEDILDLLSLSPTKKLKVPGVTTLSYKSPRVSSQIAELIAKMNSKHSSIKEGLPQSYPEPRSVPVCRSLLSNESGLVSGTSRAQVACDIIQKLISDSSVGVSIVGMDGLGKTSLARAILADQKIVTHFRPILCASVSNHFKEDDVIAKLSPTHDFPSAQKNTLIVLDDVWSVERQEWNRFISEHPGCKILITTRNPSIAEVTGTFEHSLAKMTTEDCERIIRETANLDGGNCANLNSHIKDLAEKCKGLPIIANIIGLLLRNKKELKLVNAIAEINSKRLWNLREFHEVLPCLKLDEPEILRDLQRCFSYCSLFPQDHKFNRVDLNQLWEVAGLIQQQHQTGILPPEINPFDDMLSRSILHPCEHIYRKEEVYMMHEFNHEFAHLLAPKIFFTVTKDTLLPKEITKDTHNSLSFFKSIRHLSLAYSSIDNPLLNIDKCKRLRTFHLSHPSVPPKLSIPVKLFKKLGRLRLLDLSHTNIEDVSKSNLSMHLRYLDLSHTDITELPLLCFLCALTILKLKSCSKLKQLPKDLHKLSILTHLHVDMKLLRCKPSKIGSLTKLVVLDSYFVEMEEGRTLQELAKMNDLKEINICGLENIKSVEDAPKAKLLRWKESLRMLNLEWDGNAVVEADSAYAVLESLEPHANLQNLQVKNYGGQNFPAWLGFTSHRLVSIVLDGCKSCQVLPSLGQLPYLKYLVLRYIDQVETFDKEIYGQGEESVFPYLESLEIRYMEKLADWTGLEEGYLPRLRTLTLEGCPKLVNLPSFQQHSCLMIFEINSCNELPLLPELPSPNNGQLGKLIITDCILLQERCHAGGADWSKIENIPYVEIDGIRILTTESSNLPSERDYKDQLFIGKGQFSSFTKLVKEYDFSKWLRWTHRGDQMTLIVPMLLVVVAVFAVLAGVAVVTPK